MNGLQTGQLLAFIGVLASLFIFGVVYDLWIARRSKNDLESYVPFYVIFGVLITMLGAFLGALIEPLLNAVYTLAWVLICFVATGLPMTYGHMVRYNRGRQHELEIERERVADAKKRME